MVRIKGELFPVDVDKTLIIWDEKSRDLSVEPSPDRVTVICPYTDFPYNFEIHKRNVEFVKRQKGKGKTILVWSRSEEPWAAAVVKALGLEPYVDFTSRKPVEYLDDKSDLHSVIGMRIFIDKDDPAV